MKQSLRLRKFMSNKQVGPITLLEGKLINKMGVEFYMDVLEIDKNLKRLMKPRKKT